MSARDLFHDPVVRALQKDHWVITDDPLRIIAKGTNLLIDLGAEQVFVALKGQRKIAVEVKSFIEASSIHAFHAALGQYLNYRLALSQQSTKRTLYLAVPSDVYADFFQQPFIQDVLTQFKVKLIVINIDTEVIEQWKN